jgi:hypothetical protein
MPEPCDSFAMQLSLQQLKDGLRDGTLAFCLPVAHAELSADFLEDFSERILKQDWREVSMHAHLRLDCLLADDDSEVDLVASIEENYGIDLTGLAELTLWEVMRRCAGASIKS